MPCRLPVLVFDRAWALALSPFERLQLRGRLKHVLVCVPVLVFVFACGTSAAAVQLLLSCSVSVPAFMHPQLSHRHCYMPRLWAWLLSPSASLMLRTKPYHAAVVVWLPVWLPVQAQLEPHQLPTTGVSRQ